MLQETRTHFHLTLEDAQSNLAIEVDIADKLRSKALRYLHGVPILGVAALRLQCLAFLDSQLSIIHELNLYLIKRLTP